MHVATADGSFGVRGFVIDAIDAAVAGFDYIYACGPVPMLRALYDRYDVPGQFSFEERMGCGFGACMGAAAKPSTATNASASTDRCLNGRR